MTIEEVLSEYQTVIYLFSRKYVRFLRDKTEIKSIQLRAVDYSIRTFNSSKSKFSTYLINNIRFFFLKAFRQQKKEPIFFSFAEDEEEKIIAPKNSEFDELIECLTQEQKELFIMRYLDRTSLSEIAKKYNVSKTCIHTRIVNGLTKIKEKNFD